MWIGLFGFREIRTRAGIAAGLIQVAAFGILVMAAIVADPAQQAAQQAEGPDGPGARMLARVQAALSMAIGGVGAVSLLALALLGVAVADAGTPPAAPAGTHVTCAGPTSAAWPCSPTPGASPCTGSARTPRPHPGAPVRAPPTGRRCSARPGPGRA